MAGQKCHKSKAGIRAFRYGTVATKWYAGPRASTRNLICKCFRRRPNRVQEPGVSSIKANVPEWFVPAATDVATC